MAGQNVHAAVFYTSHLTFDKQTQRFAVHVSMTSITCQASFSALACDSSIYKSPNLVTA
jgi:hypothetical protein